MIHLIQFRLTIVQSFVYPLDDLNVWFFFSLTSKSTQNTLAPDQRVRWTNTIISLTRNKWILIIVNVFCLYLLSWNASNSWLTILKLQILKIIFALCLTVVLFHLPYFSLWVFVFHSLYDCFVFFLFTDPLIEFRHLKSFRSFYPFTCQWSKYFVFVTLKSNHGSFRKNDTFSFCIHCICSFKFTRYFNTNNALWLIKS